MKTLVIAPTYKSYNHRENRLIEYLIIKNIKYELFLDRNIYKTFTYSQFKSIQKHKNKINELEDGDFLIITDPGLMGLLIAKLNKNKKVKIIFDYHDLISWEIFYQVKKFFGLNIISRIIYKLILFIVKNIIFRSKTIDYLIAISEKQIEETAKVVKWIDSPKNVIVPNVRPHIEQSYQDNELNKIDIIWMGNIQRGRDLEKIMELIALHNNEKIRLKLFGKIIDEKFFKELNQSKQIEYLGIYKSDYDILSKLKQTYAIGIFLGWDDKYRTGINQLGSPNKVFSYINIGIPVLLGGNLDTLKEMNNLGKYSLEIDRSNFVEKISLIKEEYNSFRLGANKVKNVVNDMKVSRKLYHFLDQIIK